MTSDNLRPNRDTPRERVNSAVHMAPDDTWFSADHSERCGTCKRVLAVVEPALAAKDEHHERCVSEHLAENERLQAALRDMEIERNALRISLREVLAKSESDRRAVAAVEALCDSADLGTAYNAPNVISAEAIRAALTFGDRP